MVFLGLFGVALLVLSSNAPLGHIALPGDPPTSVLSFQRLDGRRNRIRTAKARNLAGMVGISGKMVRDLMIACVEGCLHAIRAPQPVQWLSNNDGAYIAKETLDTAPAIELRSSVRCVLPRVPSFSPDGGGQCVAVGVEGFEAAATPVVSEVAGVDASLGEVTQPISEFEEGAEQGSAVFADEGN